MALDDEDEQELIADAVNSSEDEFQKHFDRRPFVVMTKTLKQLPHWVKVADVFESDSDRPFLRRSRITNLDDPRAEKHRRYASARMYPGAGMLRSATCLVSCRCPPSPPAPLCHEGGSHDSAESVPASF